MRPSCRATVMTVTAYLFQMSKLFVARAGHTLSHSTGLRPPRSFEASRGGLLQRLISFQNCQPISCGTGTAVLSRLWLSRALRFIYKRQNR